MVFKNCTHQIVAASCGDRHSCFLSSQGILYSTGYNLEGQLGIGSFKNSLEPQRVDKDESMNPIKFKKVECGSFTAAIGTDDQLYISGYVKNAKHCRPTLSSHIFKNKIKKLRIRGNVSLALDEADVLHSWCNSTAIYGGSFRESSQLCASSATDQA